MATLVVELHVPLVATPGLPANEYQYPWIMQVEDAVAALDEATDGATDYDDGEELGDDYLTNFHEKSCGLSASVLSLPWTAAYGAVHLPHLCWAFWREVPRWEAISLHE